jgi:hypothetical protein
MPALKAVAKRAPLVLSFVGAGGTNSLLTDMHLFVADREYTVESAIEVHAVAGSDGGAVTGDIKKCTGTTAIASGTTVLGSTFDLKSTAYTNVTKSRANGGVVSTPVATLARGDRLVWDITGTLTALSGVTLTVVLNPTGKP